MAFCDYCDCDLCRTGKEEIDCGLEHALTEENKWICSTCYLYEVCMDKQVELNGKHNGPCKSALCKHRPKIISKWTK